MLKNNLNSLFEKPIDNQFILVDSHCHLNYEQFEGRLDEVMQNANAHGVRFMMTINTQLSQTKDLLDLCRLHKNLVCTAGIHPNETLAHTLPLADTTDPTMLGDIPSYDSLVEHLQYYTDFDHVVGFGETGLDYYYETSPRDLQIKSFELHLQAAKQCQMPVVVHTRDADDDTVSIIKNFSDTTGVFHCFSGNKSLARAALDLGYMISFSGIITFKKASELREIVSYVPLDRMLVETDSPYLAPDPYRGRTNEPAYTAFVAKTVATEKGLTLDEVATATTMNYLTLFPKAKSFFDAHISTLKDN